MSFESGHISTFTTANTFLEMSSRTSTKLNKASLSKLMYFAAVDYGKRHGRYPFDEMFLAWQYGPVLASLREAFDAFEGTSKITNYACVSNTASTFGSSTRNRGHDWKTLVADGDMYESVEFVWNTIGGASTEKLMRWCVQPGTAWDKAYQNGMPILMPNDVITDDVCASVMSRY